MATIKDSTLYGKYVLTVMSNEVDAVRTKALLQKFWKGESPSLYGNAIYWHQKNREIEGLGERIKESKVLTGEEKDFLGRQDFCLTAFLTCDLPMPYKAMITATGTKDNDVVLVVEEYHPLPKTYGIEEKIRAKEDFWPDQEIRKEEPRILSVGSTHMVLQSGIFPGSDRALEKALDGAEEEDLEEVGLDR
jgi:hypothetical protein